MAFQFPYGSKNFVGLHADGAAATAWVKAEHWDTTNDGLGDPQEGMMFYSTLVHQMYYWDGSTWINYSGEIEGGVYVDAEHGSDVSGDGTIGRPYATLAYACAQQAAPTNLAEFATPITFYVAAGEYVDNLTFPNRLHIKVVGDDCLLSGDLEWAIDPRSWDTFLLPSANVPVLHFARRESSNGAEIDSSVAGYSQGFRLHGEIVAYNAHTGAALPMPDSHILILTGVFRDACYVYNQPAGTGVDTDAPGPMKLFLRDSKGSTGITSRIIGEVDRDLGTMHLVANEVIINAVRSDVHMNGVCKIDMLDGCEYSAAWNVDRAGGPYDYGLICGHEYMIDHDHITNSTLIFASYFGLDPAAAAPAHAAGTAYAISFDRDSLISMANLCVDLPVSFAGFSTAHTVAAYGRGWWFGNKEIFVRNKVVIPCVDTSTAFNLFAHTYSIAGNWKIDAVALATNNRLTIELESGVYQLNFATPFVFDTEFVDVIGKGCTAINGSVLGAPNTVFKSYGNTVTWEVDDARLENIQFMQYAGGGGTEYCMIMNDAATHSLFKNVVFTEDPDNLGTVYAVLIDPTLLVSVMATWEDCYTDLDRFLYGGDISPRCIRCSAGDYSFGAWNGGVPLNIVVSGYFKDCIAGNMSFAANNTDGDVTFSAIANNCSIGSRGLGNGFAYSNGGGGPSNALCSGCLTDCVAVERSFANAGTGDAEASGVFVRCLSGRYSFGCSGINTGRGIFSGTANNCYLDQTSDACFGGNSHGGGPTMCEFSGSAIDCAAGQRSFGGRGEFTGEAYRCKAYSGSFGNSTVLSDKAVLDHCECRDIINSAADGPPGLFGGRASGCIFVVLSGEVVEALRLNGDGCRVFDCDLYGDSMLTSIDAGVAVNAQIAHCRMPVAIGVNVTNILGVPYNLVDAAYVI